MFELLSSAEQVPLEPESLESVQRGMNKVRVSVGDHKSEPSEVYIITGGSGDTIETYVIFFMLEPGIRVVYGFDKNPYTREQTEEVNLKAVDFAEEMGAILEEVPWESMSPDQRAEWAAKESLYAGVSREVEEIDSADLLEVVDEDEDEIVTDENNDLHEDDELMEETDAADEAGLEPTIEEDDFDEEEILEDEAEQEEDVVVAEGDFDELLKQAFLKPDLASKRSGRKKRRVPEKEPYTESSEEEPEVHIEEEMEAGVEEPPEESFPESQDDPAPEELIQVGEAGGTARETGISGEENISQRIVRFLSRF